MLTHPGVLPTLPEREKKKKKQNPAFWERMSVLSSSLHLSHFTCLFPTSSMVICYTGLYSPGPRNSAECACTRSDAALARLLKKANGSEEEECMKHTAHQPDGGESRDVIGHGMTISSVDLFPDLSRSEK